MDEPRQDLVKRREEFVACWKKHGILVRENDLLRQDAGKDSDRVMKRRLSCGVRLLLTNSKKESRIAQRDELSDLLIQQSEFHLSSMRDKAGAIDAKIYSCLKSAIKVKPSTSISMGIERQVDVGMLELHKAKPKAKGDCKVTDMGEEVDHSDECLPRKLARLERALTYAALRATASDVEEVVGYAALCMSMVDGSSIGSTIIKLQYDMFPYLAKLQQKREVAYLFYRRSTVDGLKKIIQNNAKAERRLERVERLMWVTAVAELGICVLGIAIAFRPR